MTQTTVSQAYHMNAPVTIDILGATFAVIYVRPTNVEMTEWKVVTRVGNKQVEFTNVPPMFPVRVVSQYTWEQIAG